MIVVDARFRPLKRETLLKEALPSANPPVRLCLEHIGKWVNGSLRGHRRETKSASVLACLSWPPWAFCLLV